MTKIAGGEVVLSTVLVLAPEQLEAEIPFEFGTVLLRFAGGDAQELSVSPSTTADGNLLFEVKDSKHPLPYAYDVGLNDGEFRLVFTVTTIGEETKIRQIVLTISRTK